MRSPASCLAKTILFGLIYLFGRVSSVVAMESEWEWTGVSRIVALGDVHASYDKMITLLRGTGTIDEDFSWVGGDQHLVFCGDLTDRGVNDRAVMDLARRLQEEAEAGGGKVHVVLGNHEVMNLTRDRRYWNAELVGEFARDETQDERERGFESFRRLLKSHGGGDREAFDEMFPPGYFARARAFEPDGDYGAWLLAQPTLVRINGIVFLHGGLTRRVAELGIDEINRQIIADMRAFLDAADRMGDRVPWPADYGSILKAANELEDRGGQSRNPEVAAAQEVLDRQEGLAFDPAGPIWYRGNSVENERLEEDRVQDALRLLDANAMMVGHTVTRSGRISARFEGQVIRGDVGMGYGRPPLAAVIEDGKLLVFDPTTGEMTTAYAEPPQGEGWPTGEEDLSDDHLEKFLKRADIVAKKSIETPEGLEVEVLELERKDMRLRAMFGDVQETGEMTEAAGRRAIRSYKHQVAAYRLDREMGVDIVPVTVLREVDGRHGAVQIWIEGAIDMNELEEDNLQEILDPLAAEVARARAFSGLIGLETRADFGKLLLPVSRQLMASDNGDSFSIDDDLKDFLTEGCGPVGAAFLHALGRLDAETMERDLGDLVSAEQIEAVLVRRDELLDACAEPDPGWTVQRVLAARGDDE